MSESCKNLPNRTLRVWLRWPFRRHGWTRRSCLGRGRSESQLALGSHPSNFCSNQLSLGFKRKVHYKAGNGGSGKGSNLTGAYGEDAFVAVPPGTVIRIKEEGDGPPLAELFKHGAPGEEYWLELELKLVADVGIIGVPNAGKSTFLAAISAAKPKIANYPFTTLVPNLGVCDYDFQTTVFADVPGLLEGASKGIGLGHEFLRHCMRCRVLVHIIDGTSPDPIGDYEVRTSEGRKLKRPVQAIQLELKLFSPELASKPQVICYNKTDVPQVRETWEHIRSELLRKVRNEKRYGFHASVVDTVAVIRTRYHINT